jgi:hypothetical protein
MTALFFYVASIKYTLQLLYLKNEKVNGFMMMKAVLAIYNCMYEAFLSYLARLIIHYQ